MKKSKFLWRYLGLLLGVLSTSFLLHIWFRAEQDQPAWGDMLPYSYLINLVLAYGIVVGLHLLRKRMKHQIGFLFIAGSLLKFLLFFIFFYPSFTSDNQISRSEFASFFIPYFLSLIIETYFTAVLLKNLEKENPHQGGSPTL